MRLQFNLSLGTVDLYDRYTPDTKFPCLLQPIANASSSRWNDRLRSQDGTASASEFLSLSVEHHPVDRSEIDARVNMNMKPLNVFLSRPFLERVGNSGLRV